MCPLSSILLIMSEITDNAQQVNEIKGLNIGKKK